MESIPSTYTAVVLPDYHPNTIRAMLSLKSKQKEIRELKGDEVLIKMEAAPVNPSDIAFMQGGYNISKTTPVVPGFEGAGRVVAAGKSHKAEQLLKKKVSCFAQEDADGTWAEYFITKEKNCIPLAEDMPWEQAACFAVNPFTAYGLFEAARISKSTAIIQNAAGSQVGNFIRKLAAKSKVDVINIVRKESTLKSLQEEGAKYVLNSSEEDFEEKLREMSTLLNANVAFDAVAGKMTGTLYNSMPPGSRVVVYGGLSGKAVSQVDVLQVIFKNKIIKGFNLNDYILNTGRQHFQEISDELQQMFISGEMKTEIQHTFLFDKIVDALKLYLGNMSKGKVLLKSGN